MAKASNFPERQTWGTWEELLLACAVHRYGTDSWDSVAREVQKRSSALHLLSPHACQQKYDDLNRRFTSNGAVSGTDKDENTPDATTVPWLEELRKLRVAELRREVQRYDLSIVSLQLKVKRLKEEHEQSIREDQETKKSDLKTSEYKDEGEREKSKDDEPEIATEKPVNSEESDRDNGSVNESNFRDPKGESSGIEPKAADEKEESVEAGGDKPKQISEEKKSVGEDSCNGSSDSVVAKESAPPPDEKSGRINPEREDGGSPEFESVAESKGAGKGEEGANESSEAQSSASLSGRRKREPESEPDEPDNENQSPAIKRVSIESQPLVDFLQIIRSHKCGSVFERRLKSQETLNYSNLIRQHIDLEIIQMHVEEGWYSGSNSKFFRDLLLLVTNATTFFTKKSSEFTSAVELRQLISKEMASKTQNPTLLEEQPSTALQQSSALKPHPEPSQSKSIPIKPKISVTLIACRKRSSITAKASSSSSGPDKKGHQTDTTLMDEKPVLQQKQRENSSDKADDQDRVIKKNSRERPTSSTRSLTRNNNSQTNAKAKKNSDASTSADHSSKGRSTNDSNSESKAEKDKVKNTNANTKKESVAKFLTRMKRSSSSSNGPLLETSKSSGVSSSDDGRRKGVEQKKNGNVKGDALRGSSGKLAKEQGSPAKRAAGRPPKRAAAEHARLPTPAKRIREDDESEAGAPRQAKKRSRK